MQKLKPQAIDHQDPAAHHQLTLLKLLMPAEYLDRQTAIEAKTTRQITEIPHLTASRLI